MSAIHTSLRKTTRKATYDPNLYHEKKARVCIDGSQRQEVPVNHNSDFAERARLPSFFVLDGYSRCTRARSVDNFGCHGTCCSNSLLQSNSTQRKSPSRPSERLVGHVPHVVQAALVPEDRSHWETSIRFHGPVTSTSVLTDLTAVKPDSLRHPHVAANGGGGSPSSNTVRRCHNCKAFETRQWVRGDSHSWLCHSCGQFWRKNGYARPQALWNRPTFKRSSRKRKNDDHSAGAERKVICSKLSSESVSSSFLKGKQMVECEEQLSPAHYVSNYSKTHATPSEKILRQNHVLPQLHDTCQNDWQPSQFIRDSNGATVRSKKFSHVQSLEPLRLPPLSVLVQATTQRGSIQRPENSRRGSKFLSSSTYSRKKSGA